VLTRALPPDRRVAIALYAAACVAAALVAPRGPLYWDSAGYVVQAIKGEAGGLGLGRPLFVFASHVIARSWLAAGGSAWSLEPVLRWSWAALSASSGVLTWRVARSAGLPRRAAWIAGAAVAVSPALAQVSGAVLTDGPALAASLWATLCAVRAATAPAEARTRAVRWAGAAGLVLGIAIGIREQAALTALVFAGLVRAAPRASRLRMGAAMAAGCAVAALLPIVILLLTQPGFPASVKLWIAGIAQDRARHVPGWRDVLIAVGWWLSLSPVLAPAALITLRHRGLELRRSRILAAIVVPAFLALLLLLAYPSLSYSPRYLLPVLPGAVALPGAIVLHRWVGSSRIGYRLLFAALVAPLVIAAPIVRSRSARLEQTLRDWPGMLLTLPPGSVVVSGLPCASVPLVIEEVVVASGQRVRPDWQPVCPGWGWPPDLSAALDAALRSGHVVALDLRAGSWVGAEQQAARAQARAYRQARRGASPGARLVVWDDEERVDRDRRGRSLGLPVR
jgi:hypothetical protein